MSNILPPADAESVSFSGPVRDNEASDRTYTREELQTVLDDAEIGGDLSYGPLPDETINPHPQSDDAAQEEARKNLDPIVSEQLEDDRLGDEIAFDGLRAQEKEEFDEKVDTEINRRGRVVAAFERNSQNFAAEVGDFYETVFNPDVTISPALAEVAKNSPDGPRLLYNLLTSDPAQLDKINGIPDAAGVATELNVVRRHMGLAPRAGVTNPPPPVPTLGGRGATVRRSPDKMSQDEYAAGRRSGRIR
ncbi:hypothetical protein LCGC14_2306130 [marine sediment metagenome]|uniref:Scaffolding protein n=1 Tax=marine sediment metagenome TaxID=412755 RepID=A0A0F9CMJ0_9ZZZZ